MGQRIFSVPYFRFWLDLFLNLGCLTNSVTQIVELSTSYLTLTDNVYLFYVGRVNREGLLYATAVRNTSYRERLGDSAAMLSNDSSFEHLDSLASTLLDLVVNTDRVTNVDNRNLGLQLLVCKSLNQSYLQM